MSSKLNSYSSKTSSFRHTVSRTGSAKPTKVANPRKVLTSQKLPKNAPNDRKAYSAGFIKDNKLTKPKKITKSDYVVGKPPENRTLPIDHCRNCGDTVFSSSTNQRTTSNSNTLSSTSTASKINTKHDTGIQKNTSDIAHASMRSLSKGNARKINTDSKFEGIPKPIQQYYKNENYRPSTETIEEITNGTKKISLDTIKEVSEIYPSGSAIKIYSDSDDDITFLDTDDQDSLKRLKEFRQKNYFECHSAKCRIRNRGNATSLQNHKCVYRFYLNDRLFPVPLSTDHNNQVRCVECLLPMELNVEEATKINGTIQAKVTIGKKNQDIMLLLPVKEPLIITEKRKVEKQKDREVVFFGVINLDGFGHSIFNSTLPGDSLALKYQKGYKEFESKRDLNYKDFDRSDVVVI